MSKDDAISGYKDQYLDKDIIDIFEINGEKYIHFFGYGYESEENKDNGFKEYRILEYVGFCVPLHDVIKCGYSEYLDRYSEFFKQCISDVTYMELTDAYQHWDNGNEPEFLEELTLETKPGCYIY